MPYRAKTTQIHSGLDGMHVSVFLCGEGSPELSGFCVRALTSLAQWAVRVWVEGAQAACSLGASTLGKRLGPHLPSDTASSHRTWVGSPWANARNA